MPVEYPPRLLMCPPRHFEVSYSINPWMDREAWRKYADTFAQTTEAEWLSLKALLEQFGAVVDLMVPVPEVPDLVFTANAAVVLDGKALLARFRYPERRLEEPHFAAAIDALVKRNILKSSVSLPAYIVLEGAGDCIWDPQRELFWIGFGPRSSKQATMIVEDTFGFPTLSMDLVDARFYHLDTAFSVLSNGEIMYFKGALSSSSLRMLYEHVNICDRIEVSEQDACSMCLNGIRIGRRLIFSSCSPRLQRQLADRGYFASVTSLSSFMLSGGSAFGLTLRTGHASRRHPRARPRTQRATPNLGDLHSYGMVTAADWIAA
ncbi:arginine deiminase-related protein [Mesorhizobium australicum]|uniref:dimethylarginine dimethylaminohydrolase family protein n=1 Tax=Mesorhizobium australicum TaxID=536018 RepID=UPI003338CAF7